MICNKGHILFFFISFVLSTLNGQNTNHVLKGYIHESHPIEISFTSNESELSGVLNYPNSELQFELEGISVKDTFLFVESDPKFGNTGNIKLFKESNQYVGFWTDKEKNRFFQIQVSKDGIKRPKNLEIFRGKLIDDNIRLFYHANGAYLNGKLYNEGTNVTLDFNGKFTNSDGSHHTGVLWERGVYKGKMNINKNASGDLQVSFLSETGVSQFVVFQKVGEIQLEHDTSFGYDYYADFIGLKGLDVVLKKGLANYRLPKKNSYTSMDRSREVVDGWIDFHLITHSLISGIYQIESIQKTNYSNSFIIDRKSNQLLNLNTFFKKMDWKNWCSQLIEKKFPGKLKEEAKLYSWYKEGLRVSSQYDSENGFSYVVIPREEIEPILSKQAQKYLK
jgi:hypothetical protein